MHPSASRLTLSPVSPSRVYSISLSPSLREHTQRGSGSLPFEAADRERPRGTRWQVLFRLTDVTFRILVDRGDAREVPRLESGEGNGQVMALLQPGEAAEVGQALAFFLGHVIAVGQVRRGDGGEPGVAAGLVLGDLGNRVPDVVVVADGVQGLSLCPGPLPRGQAHLQQRGIEDRLL